MVSDRSDHRPHCNRGKGHGGSPSLCPFPTRRRELHAKYAGLCAFFPVSGIRFTIVHPDVAALPDSGLPRLLREARLGMGLTKREAARRLGVCVDVVGQWERGAHVPRIQYHPAIIEFLGHDDWLNGRTLADRMRRCRARMGWTQARLGQLIGASETTIARWEGGQSPSASKRGRVERMLAGLSESDALVAKAEQRARR